MKALVFALAFACSLPAFASAENTAPFDEARFANVTKFQDVGLLPKQKRITKADDDFYKSPEGLSRIGYMVAEVQDEADDIASTEQLARDELRIQLMQTSVFNMTTVAAAQ